MSRSQLEILTCPECGNKQQMEVWRSLNVTLDPDLRQELFDKQINIFTCAHCEATAFINTTLLYHDMEREFTIYYLPLKQLEDPETLSEFDEKGQLTLFADNEKAGYMVRPHVVFNLQEMIYYAMFREQLASQQST